MPEVVSRLPQEGLKEYKQYYYQLLSVFIKNFPHYLRRYVMRAYDFTHTSHLFSAEQ